MCVFFLKVGSVLFGSGYVPMAFLRAHLVDRWHWLTEGQLLDAIAVGQFTPGPVFTTRPTTPCFKATGAYRLSVMKPADGSVLAHREFTSKDRGEGSKLALPSFTDDLAVRIKRTQPAKRTSVPGTQ